MNSADVPDELLQAAAEAYWTGPPPPPDAPIWVHLRKVVAAVLPLHEQQVRGTVAAEAEQMAAHEAWMRGDDA